MLQDKSEPVVSDVVAPTHPYRKVAAKKRASAVKLREMGMPYGKIAEKLGVSQQRVGQYLREARDKKKPAKKAPKAKSSVKYPGSFHRLAQKVQRGTVEAMQSEVSDYLTDVLLLCREILREG